MHWVDACGHTHCDKSVRTTTITQTGDAPFSSARSLHPTPESGIMLSPGTWANRNPDVPPYVVRTPHLHEAPTAEETSEVKRDEK